MRRYTTFWNVWSQKWPCSRAEWSKLSCKTQPFETVAEKYSFSDVSTILLTDEKIYTVVTLKNLKITLRNCSNQEERCRDKTLAHTVSVQTVIDGISRRVTTFTSGRENTSLILSFTEPILLKAVVLMWWCNITVTTRHTLDLKRVLQFQQDSARRTWCLRQSTFLPITSPDIDWFKKSFKADSAVNL